MGAVQAPGQVRLTLVNGDLQELKAERLLVALGSQSVESPQIPLDGDRMVTSSEALCWQEPPAHLLIVGGGYIGLELGSVWRRLGSRVTVVESQERILPAMDEGLARRRKGSLPGRAWFSCVDKRCCLPKPMPRVVCLPWMMARNWKARIS